MIRFEEMMVLGVCFVVEGDGVEGIFVENYVLVFIVCSWGEDGCVVFCNDILFLEFEFDCIDFVGFGFCFGDLFC